MEEAPVLDDEGIGAQLRAAAYELEGLDHLLVLDDDVHGDVDARAREMRGAACRLEALVGKVIRLAPCVERPHAAVDGVRARCQRGGEWRRAARGSEQLGVRDVMGNMADVLDGHALPFEANYLQRLYVVARWGCRRAGFRASRPQLRQMTAAFPGKGRGYGEGCRARARQCRATMESDGNSWRCCTIEEL